MLISLSFSLEKNLKNAKTTYKDSSVPELMQDRTASELLGNKFVYHESCYSSFANINKLDREKKRYLSSIETDECSVVKRKQERPSIKGRTTDIANRTPMTRSKLHNCDKTLCIACQQRRGFLCKVEFKQTGRTMLPVAEKPTDKS